MTYLCVPIFVRDFDAARAQIVAAVEAGATMIELRFDAYPDLANREAYWSVSDLAAATTVPVIFTCRPDWEGGQCDLIESNRIDYLLRNAARNSRFAFIDVELAAHEQPPIVHNHLIISSHDFTGRPDRLYNILADMNARSAAVNKIAWLARTVRDNLEAFEILKDRNRPTIALCMGEAGIISRILAKKFNAFLTFASLNKDSATAPGQITITELKNLYRWDALNPKTKVYGVVAHPVGHSMSPAIHNAAFTATNYDGVYLPFLVEPGYESFKAFMESFLAFKPLDLSGLSITIPHKENALRYLQWKNATIDPLAARIGAINTITIAPDGTLSGQNTDYPAILDCITEKLQISREQLKDLRIAILGAGGTARAAVAALTHYGAQVEIQNRTQTRAQELAAEFHATATNNLPPCDIYFNTTSVGMSPNIDGSPLDAATLPLTKDSLVFDAIYNPMQTLFLRQAQSAGAKTIGGVEMFLKQAAAQFQSWTNLPAPLEVMRQTIERILQKK